MTRYSDEIGENRDKEQISRSAARIIGPEEMPDHDARELARKAMARVDTHETLCTERWNQQRLAMSMLQRSLDQITRNTLGRVPAGIIACLTGLVGWLAARAFPIHG